MPLIEKVYSEALFPLQDEVTEKIRDVHEEVTSFSMEQVVCLSLLS